MEIKETEIEIEEDRDLDYTKLENVEKILTKYKNQQLSRKNFDCDKHIEVFDLIYKAQSNNLNIQIEVTMLLVSTYFLLAKQTATGFFNRDTWNKTNDTITLLVTLLKSKVFDSTKDKKATKEKEDGGDLDQFLQSNDAQILPALVTFIERLDQQLYKAFQNLTQTQMEYLYRLKDECQLVKQCDNLMSYLSQHNDMEKVARVGLIKLEHIYYKNDSLYEKTKQALKGKADKLAELYFLDKPSAEVIEDIVANIVKNCSYKLKVKAILLQVYHHAIHNRY